MRIVYLLTSLGVGGAERQALSVAARMAGRGHEVAVLVLRPRLSEQWPTGLPTVHLEMRRNPASVLASLVRGRRFLREFRPDLVHSHSFHANFVARLLKLVAPEPVVLSTVHNVYEGGWPRMLAYRLTDGLSQRTTAVSEAAARRFVRVGAVPVPKCLVVPNAIESAEFIPDAQRRREMRARMRVDGEFVWLAAGRIMPAKDYPTLLGAFARVYAARPEVRLWIAGEGEPLRVLTAELGLDGCVAWLGLRRDMTALLDAADGLVLSSAWEGMPLAVAEAMAMEKPVVATDVGGVRELMGGTNAVVPCRDPAALAAAMLNVMMQPAAGRLALGHAARARIVDRFDMDARAAEWEEIYRGLLQGHAKL